MYRGDEGVPKTATGIEWENRNTGHFSEEFFLWAKKTTELRIASPFFLRTSVGFFVDSKDRVFLVVIA